MSWHDLEQDIREEFDSWARDIEQVFYVSGLSETARATEYARAWRRALRQDPVRWAEHRQRVRAYQREQRANGAPKSREARARYRARVRADQARREAARAAARARRERREESGPMVSCACGCGVTFPKFGKCGKPRRFAHLHQARLQGNTTQGILDVLGRGPTTASEIARLLGKPAHVVAPALSRLRRKGRVVRMGRGWLWALAGPVSVQQPLPLGVVVRLDAHRRRARAVRSRGPVVLPGQLSLFDEVAA